MAGSMSGGKKAAETNKAKYGEGFYARIGAMGGRRVTRKPKGFGANHALASLAGSKGGSRSKRGVKMSDEEKKATRQLYYARSRQRFCEDKLKTLTNDIAIAQAEELYEQWCNRVKEAEEKLKEFKN